MPKSIFLREIAIFYQTGVCAALMLLLEFKILRESIGASRFGRMGKNLAFAASPFRYEELVQSPKGRKNLRVSIFKQKS